MAAMKMVSLLRPCISHQVKLSKPPLILFWNLKIGLCVVCRLEVALFATLPSRVSGRKRPYLSLHPFCVNRLQGLPQDFGWGFCFPKWLIWFISGIDKLVLVFCFTSKQKKPRNRKGRCLDFCPCVGLKCLLPELSKAAVQTQSFMKTSDAFSPGEFLSSPPWLRFSKNGKPSLQKIRLHQRCTIDSSGQSVSFSLFTLWSPMELGQRGDAVIESKFSL